MRCELLVQVTIDNGGERASHPSRRAAFSMAKAFDRGARCVAVYGQAVSNSRRSPSEEQIRGMPERADWV
jgi:hypothetical protein